MPRRPAFTGRLLPSRTAGACLTLALLALAARGGATEALAHGTPPGPALAKLPVRFEANVGQLDPRVRFLARAPGMVVSLTDEGATLAVGATGAPVTMRVTGGGSRHPRAGELLEGRSSYFLGSDRARWRANVPSFGKVTYPSVIPGVDEVFHGEGGAVEYDFVVAPGVQPDAVEVMFDGAESVSVDGSGALRVHAGGGTLVQPKPRVYQRSEGREVAIASRYRVTGPKSVAFDVGAYDPTKAVVIDPVLAYSTFLGGSGNDYGYGVAVDATGAIYVTGFTTSPDFPAHDGFQPALTGAQDVFVTKLDPTGHSVVYSTYIGGSAHASGYGIAVDAKGAAYVVGNTDSADFPTVGAIQKTFGGILDAFALKLSPAGDALTYSTLLGGSAADSAYGVAVDAEGDAYVGGTTGSGDFPTAHATQAAFGGTADAFIAELDPTGHAFVYSTYIGGTGDDEGRGLAIDAKGAAYLVGYTSSIDLPTVTGATPAQALNNGAENVFVAKLAPADTALAYVTYLGGSQADLGQSIAVDDTGAAYVTGTATSADFPTVHPFQSTFAGTGLTTAFVAKLDPTASKLVYSTYLGGTGGDFGESIAVTHGGDAFVVGYTASPDFPTKAPTQAFNAASGTSGGSNAFVTELDASGDTLVFSTYLGGSLGDSAESIAVSASGDAYVTGYTVSPDFPTVEPEQAALGSATGDNAFVAVFRSHELVGDAGVPDATRTAFDAAPGGSPTIDAASIYDASEPGSTANTSTIAAASGDGCSCSTSKRPSPSSAAWALPILGLLSCVRRRRRVAFDRDLP